jgi:IclR family pca regulon transcriptional regulator
MRLAKKPPGDRFVQSLARGLAVIRTFRADTPQQTLTEVAARTGLDRAASRRLLLTLESLGYVRLEDRSFSLTPKILDLGYSYLSTTPSWSIAERKMIDLVGTVRESATLGVLLGTHIVLVACVHAQNLLTINLAVGRRSPAYCTSIGRTLLGGLSEEQLARTLKASTLVKYTKGTTISIPELKKIIDRDRVQGWSMVSQEYEKSVCSISVPVLSGTGQLIAAMCVVGTPVRTSPKEMMERILPRLKRTAETVWE